MSPSWFELADSELLSVAPAGDRRLRLLLSAARAEHEGVPGFLGGVEMLFGEAVWSGDLAACVGALAGGELDLAGQPLRRVPLPLAAAGPVAAEIRFKAGALLSVRAGSLACASPDGSRFVESFAC